MVKHCVIMSSSYSDGTRIALDVANLNHFDEKQIMKIMDTIKRACGKDTPLSTHFLTTKSDTWESIVDSDPFFEGVVCIKTVDEFSQKIKKDRLLSGLDVANYIVSMVKCTHLSLEKLVYFAYADYLCKTSRKLFVDDIYAFAHGPVVKSVYETYKRSGSQYIEPLKFGDDSDVHAIVKEMPARSRILFAEDGISKLKSIDETIKKYGRYSAGYLVDLTHRVGSPWSHIDSTKAYQIIPDEIITEYHHIETI